jgi:hypothetical protein
VERSLIEFIYADFVYQSKLVIFSNDGVPLLTGFVDVQAIKLAADTVNEQLRNVHEEQLQVLDIFDIIDLRMLSGLIGELFSNVLAKSDERLLKNPNIDGYPDLCDVSDENLSLESIDFIKFPNGGIEVKNTFGVKKSGSTLLARETRREKIQRQLVWKAHHQFTNNLLALQSDYVENIPQIVAAYFSDQLCESDWTQKQNPSEGSTMTSFCQTTRTAFEKLKAGAIFADPDYLRV